MSRNLYNQPPPSNHGPDTPSGNISHMQSQISSYEPTDEECPGNGIIPPVLPISTHAHMELHRSEAPQWHYPVYNAGASPPDSARNFDTEHLSLRSTRYSAIGPTNELRDSKATLHNPVLPPPEKADQRRYSSDLPYTPPSRRFSVSAVPDIPPLRLGLPRPISPVESLIADDDYETDLRPVIPPEKRLARRGVLSNILEYHQVDNDSLYDDHDAEDPPIVPHASSGDSFKSDFYLEENPLHQLRLQDLENQRNRNGENYGVDEKKRIKVGFDPLDVEFTRIARLTHLQRRKEASKALIERHITSMLNRQRFLCVFSRALLYFSAPTHRLETQLVATAKILDVTAEFMHFPGILIISFVDDETRTTETHFVKCAGALQLGRLHEVHEIYKGVVHDIYSAKVGTQKLEALLAAPAVYSDLQRCGFAFVLSALICPLAFGGSFVDLWLAGCGAWILCLVKLKLSTKNSIYANVFEILVVMLVSFVSRALSIAKNEVFCYAAISSSSVISILPGYLILTSSLDLGSKNILCGSIKLVYALIYTLILGFGLQIGSDLYLLFNPKAFQDIKEATKRVTGTLNLAGSFIADNTTQTIIPPSSTFTFTDALPPDETFMILGCYRPPGEPWYLRPTPFWAQLFIVPVFSIFSSLSNLQPIDDLNSLKNLLVMVVVSCISYTTNKIASHYIYNQSNMVSAIGAFTIGILGNSWSRITGGSGFTSMVTGVLFLVPTGLSQAGGFTTDANSIEVGSSMISVAIGITVGLFMSQALVHCFKKSRKDEAAFSF